MPFNTFEREYIVIEDFNVRHDMESFLLYLDYFSIQHYKQSVSIPSQSLRKFKYHLLRKLRIALFTLGYYHVFYRKKLLPDNALIIFKGRGSTIKLIKENETYIIRKFVFDEQKYKREKNFYDTYKTKKSLIRLPNHVFLKDNIIEIQFMKVKSFQRLIADGSVNFKKAINLLKIIKNELKLLYGNKPTLVHGDFWLTNIFIKNNEFYLIDFNDSFISNYRYDIYILLRSILVSFRFINKKGDDIVNHPFDKKQLQEILDCTEDEFEKLQTI